MSIAGLYLTDGECKLAVLTDELKLHSLETNEEIIKHLSDVTVLAVNAALKTGKELTDTEKDLQEEGYIFSPGENEETLRRRASHLKQLIKQKGLNLELVRFDPMITSRELALDGDKALESMGIDSSSIESSQGFDAALGAVTARFYQQDQFKDLGVIVPKPLHNT